MKWIILTIALVIPAILPLFNQGFFPTHDSVHVPRVYEMDRGLRDGQFPVRWTPDVRYGEATFNFYAPLPYYIGAGISHLGLSYIDSTKALIALGFIFSALAMFLLVRELYGRWAGIVAAAFYTFAPYHSVDIYVRGALPESWALIFLPLIFWSVYRLSLKKGYRDLIFLSLSVAGLLLTHNIMSLMFSVFAAAWTLLLVLKNKDLGFLKLVVFAVVLGMGLSAFFWLPAFVEKDLVQNKYLTTGYFDFRGHFVGLQQFFSTKWGYESSVFWTEDNISFQLGLVHWLTVFISVGFLIWKLFKRNIIKNKDVFLILFFLGALLASLFVQHNQSGFIWEAIPLMSYIQFPWRFLGISIFLVSIIAGFAVSQIKFRNSWVSIFLIILVIGVNVNYFRPRIYEPLTDKDYISDEILANKDRTPKDYLPNAVKVVKDRVVNDPVVSPDLMEITNFQKRSASASFNAEVKKTSHISVPIYYFPNWEVYIDGQKITQTEPNDEGWIGFNIPTGNHQVLLKFENTPIRTAANMASLFSISLLLGIFLYRRRSKEGERD